MLRLTMPCPRSPCHRLQMARHRLLRFSSIAAATLPLPAAEDAVRDVVDDLGQRMASDILNQARALAVCAGRCLFLPHSPQRLEGREGGVISPELRPLVPGPFAGGHFR